MKNLRTSHISCHLIQPQNLISFVLFSPRNKKDLSGQRENGIGEDKNFHEALPNQQATGKGTDPEISKDGSSASQSHHESPKTLVPYSGLLDTLATGMVWKYK